MKKVISYPSRDVRDSEKNHLYDECLMNIII